jgi:Cu/Ag efflux protein CusF
MKQMKRFTSLSFLLLATVLVALPVASAGTPIKRPDAPCCVITGFTPVDGVVAAREAATGRTFQFKVNDAALLKTLKVGQKIYANFATKKVSVDGFVPCCNFTPVDGFGPVDGVRGNEPPPTGTGYGPVDGVKRKVNPGLPCCAITGFTPVDGVVAARETATGRTFQFKVNDAALLKSLKVGQMIYANFATKKVSVDGAYPCCAFTPVDGFGPVDGVRGTEQPPAETGDAPVVSAKLVQLQIPPSLRAPRGAATISKTEVVDTKYGRGTVRVEVTRDAKIANVAVSKNLVEAGLALTTLLDKAPRKQAKGGSGPSPHPDLSDCIDKDKCADKPTREGVAVCVGNCVVKVLIK